MKYIIILYFDLKEEQNEIIEKIEQLFDDYDFQLFMMKEMGDMLPPLDYWNKKQKRFDEWQLNVIQHVQKKKM